MDDCKLKKDWITPDLTVYGDMADLTQGSSPNVCKVVGFGDDILQTPVPGVSTFPGSGCPGT